MVVDAKLFDDTIYLDHAATTPVDPAVLAAMMPFLTQHYGNPSSIYRLGQDARAGLDTARVDIARMLRVRPDEILFTSGATESCNLALRGVAWRHRTTLKTIPHIVTTAIEHHAVLHTAESLTEQGFDVSVVPCNSEGIVSPAAIEAALRPETCLISMMYANNEVGSIQPIAETGALASSRGIAFHCDAVQAAGMLPLDLNDLPVDLLSLSAHKFYGPKGVGILFVRKGTPVSWQQTGGGQEAGRRGGTESVALAVGFATALTLAEQRRLETAAHCAVLRDRMLATVRESVDGVTLNGPADPAHRLPNNLNVAIDGVQGETVLLGLDMLGIAASAGSACTTGNSEPSHVLRAMNMSDDRCRSSLRFSLGSFTTSEEIDEAVDALVETVERVRSLTSAA